MNKVHVFTVISVIMAAVVAIQSASLENETQNRRRMVEGRRCPRAFRGQTVTAGNRTCYCKPTRGFFGIPTQRWSDCRDSTPEPSTTPAVTDAPVTDPPVTDAPVTDAPVTDPPVTDAPVTNPPFTDPPIQTSEIPPSRDAELKDSSSSEESQESPESQENVTEK